ncbi:MAG TPA: DUF305 domain-containing protein [Candidatus Binatia bacterium]|jgi:uncharacterized protein (DUF305 family)
MRRQLLVLVGGLAVLALVGGCTLASMSHGPGAFDAEMTAAMTRMDAGMAIASSGNPDRDFAAMMIPHHQGAVDMALLELRYGKDPGLKRLAQEIVVTQRQEIDVMQRALDAMAATSPPQH